MAQGDRPLAVFAEGAQGLLQERGDLDLREVADEEGSAARLVRVSEVMVIVAIRSVDRASGIRGTLTCWVTGREGWSE